MTQTEKRLRRAGLGEHIDNGDIVIQSTRQLEVGAIDTEISTDDNVVYDHDKTELLVSEVLEAVRTGASVWGGFKCAGGWWYLEKNYTYTPHKSLY